MRCARVWSRSRSAWTKWPRCATASSPAIADEPPVTLADGGTIRDGFDAALDELRDISRNSTPVHRRRSKRASASAPASRRSRSASTTSSATTSRSRRPNLHLAPADYERKQTLVNAERFTTPELKELESKILDAEEKILDLEREIFAGVRAFAAAHAARIRSTAAAVAELDVTAALAAGGRGEPLHAPALLRIAARCESSAAATR